MEIFLTILIILIFYLILITVLALVRALFSIRKGKARAKENSGILFGSFSEFLL